MKIFLFFFIYLFSLLTHAQTIEIEGKEYTWEDLEHENHGCPANSTCSAPMGKKILSFKKFLQANKSGPNFWKQLESYRLKNGLPVNFLTQGENKSLDPVVWDSRCEIHHNKDKSKEVVKAMQFFHNNPKSELISFDPVWIDNVKYEIPYEGGPILVENNSIVIATEFDDTYFYLSIDQKGKWKVVNLSSEDMEKAISVREDTECPSKEKRSLKTPFYSKTYCKKIWDRSLKKERVIELSWSCP